MKKLAHLVAVTMFCFGAVACGGGHADQMAALQKEACECKDMACYDKVQEKWKAMEKDLEAKYPKKSDAPKDLIEAYGKNRSAMRECRSKLKKSDG